MLIFIILAVILLLCLLQYKLNRRNLEILGEKIPGPKGVPLLGVLPRFFGKSNEEILAEVLEIVDCYENVARFWLGNKLILMIKNLDYVKSILNSVKCLDKAFAYEFLSVNLGLISCKSNVWRFHRKYLNNCFTPKLLQSFMPIFNRSSARMSQYMSKHLGRGEFDLYHFVGKCTLDMICTTSMGLDHDFQGPTGDIYIQSADILAETINKRIFNIFYHPKQIYNFTKAYVIESKAWSGLRTVSSRVIENAEKTYVKPVSSELNVKSELRKPCIFVEQVYKLFQYTKEFDEQMLKDEIDTLIAGGNETSGMTTSFCILMMAMHPDVQERVVDELRSIFETADDEVTQDHISQLDYLTMVLQETLRLFPITPFIGREVQEDIQLDEYTLPKGASLVIPIFKLQRQEEIWGPEAHLFNPDNFLPENVEKRHPYAWIPFSAGQRNCIGMKYSLLAMKTMLCYLLRNYKFNTTLKYSELKFKMALDLKIVNKHMVSIEKRKFK
ncbi:cytochrome P450 4c21-like isoform X1 [Culicoides brevitarsis]|uniref:cytochrome P450 4c21-like isoform X1 n=1 Tax=Culicoides brevitarsis TaxID=469753 RepID=UPI00307BE35F